MAYAWSQKGISYILSTCGSTEPSPNMYKSYFEGDFGNVSYKELNRPSIAHLLFDYLPLIDEHNKQRQNRLALETKWPTRCCWFRLLTTLIGMCVVDLHRLYKHCRPEQFGELDILQFSDVLCKNLRKRPNRQERRLVQRRNIVDGNGLERIADDDGNLRYTITTTQQERGRNVGKSLQQTCYICRKYLDKEGNIVYRQTNFRCKYCRMPLCKRGREREQTCAEEHYSSDNLELGCFGNNCSFKAFPKEMQVQFTFRSSPLPSNTYRSSPPPLPPTPLENESHGSEETTREQVNANVIGLINQRITRSQAKRVLHNRAEV